MKKIAALLVGCGLAGAVPSGIAQASGRPNIVVVFADDQGVNDASPNDHRVGIHTPHMQRLADRGVVFTEAYASSSMCTPSRVGMLSGRAPARFGVYDVGGDSHITWPAGQKILSQYLKEAGYRTAVIGKWHCGGDIEEWGYNHPLERGFDRFWGFMGSTHDYFDAAIGSGVNGAGYWSCGYNPIYDQREIVEEIGYLTDDIAEQSVRFIRENRDAPFFLYMAHHCPHVPLQVPEGVYNQYLPLGYRQKATVTRAMHAVMDQAVGAVLDELERYGLLENTLVIYSSDNGGSEGSAQLNNLLRGGKFSLMEGGLRVPLFISWPAVLPQGVVFCDPVWNLDFTPTVLAAAGIVPEGEMDGVNLLPFLLGEKTAAPHEALCWEGPYNTGSFAIRAGDWKLVYCDQLGRGLFNLSTDPQETTDLRSQYPERTLRLQKSWDGWAQSNRPSQWTSALTQQYRARKISDNPLENAIYQYNDTFGQPR